MINKSMVFNLVGVDDFTEILIHLPDEFYKLKERDQESMWGAVIGQINDGIWELQDLISFAYYWVETFLQVRDIPADHGNGLINL